MLEIRSDTSGVGQAVLFALAVTVVGYVVLRWALTDDSALANFIRTYVTNAWRK